jgi:hypothetical protein
MLKQTIVATIFVFATAAIGAQTRPAPRTTSPQAPDVPTPATAPRPEQPAAARPAEPAGQPVNIRLELTITDQAGPGEPVRKQVTMLVADGQNANVRTSGHQRVSASGTFPVTDVPISINVDARPLILRDGSIRLNLGLEYQPRPNSAQPDAAVQAAQMSSLNERIGLIVQDGKPLMISQASDPGSDRKVTVELRATVVK